MRLSILAVVILGLSLMPLTVGCSKTSPQGGPGADKKDKGGTADKAGTGANDSSTTFEVKVPSSTNVTQGSQNNEDISLSRGRNFNQTVVVTFKPAEGIKLNPDKLEFKGDVSKLSVNVTAADDATVGDHIVNVNAKPETGKDTSVNWTINVKKK